MRRDGSPPEQGNCPVPRVTGSRIAKLLPASEGGKATEERAQTPSSLLTDGTFLSVDWDNR